MLRIRFFRVGKKNQPSFKIVVTDRKNPPRGGRLLEELGFYNPLTKEKALKQERIKFWLKRGAQPSETVHNLLVREKVIKDKKKPVHKKTKKKEGEKEEKPKPSDVVPPKEEKPVSSGVAPQEEKKKEEEKPKEEKPAASIGAKEEAKKEKPAAEEGSKEEGLAVSTEAKGEVEGEK
jgi:small subunit ribosomal protein S16